MNVLHAFVHACAHAVCVFTHTHMRRKQLHHYIYTRATRQSINACVPVSLSFTHVLPLSLLLLLPPKDKRLIQPLYYGGAVLTTARGAGMPKFFGFARVCAP